MKYEEILDKITGDFEGIEKRKIADDNLALLKEIGVETIEMDNQELFKHINNKTTFDEAFKIYFKKMAEGLKGLTKLSDDKEQ